MVTAHRQQQWQQQAGTSLRQPQWCRQQGGQRALTNHWGAPTNSQQPPTGAAGSVGSAFRRGCAANLGACTCTHVHPPMCRQWMVIYHVIGTLLRRGQQSHMAQVRSRDGRSEHDAAQNCLVSIQQYLTPNWTNILDYPDDLSLGFISAGAFYSSCHFVFLLTCRAVTSTGKMEIHAAVYPETLMAHLNCS